MTDQPFYYAEEPDSPGHTPIYVQRPGEPREEIDKRLDLRSHSPDGFSWGYAGSGPAQLSLAILCDYYGDDDFAVNSYRRFLKVFVSQYEPSAPFYVSADEIEDAVERGR